MKFKLILIILFLLFQNHSYSQKKTKNTKNTYISIRLFKQIYNRKLTKEELETIKIKPNDTLVLARNISDIEKFFSTKESNLSTKEFNLVSVSKSYMSIADFKKISNKSMTKNDSINFKYRDGDTLVLVNEKDFNKNLKSVPYEPKDSAFLEVYKDIVYRKYQKKNTGTPNNITLKHWNEDIKIFFAESVDKTVKKELKSFANYLSNEVDSLKILFVDEIEKSNYVIYGYDYINNYKYDKRIKSNSNDYYISWDGNQWLNDCKFQINKYSFKNKEDLITHSKIMFFTTLGYFSKTLKLPKESYLSLLNSKNKQLTNMDLELLKYHYSYGICKGVDLKTFEEQHKRAQDIYKRTGRHLQFRNKN